MNMLIEIRKRIEGAILVALVLLGAWWWTHVPQKAPEGPQVAVQAPQLSKVGKDSINPPEVPVFKPEAKKKLNLTPEIQADPHKHVLDSSRIPEGDRDATVTTVIDDRTGLAETMFTREPYPWLAAEKRGEVGMYYGMKNGGQKVGRLMFKEDLLQVKALHFGILATLDGDGQYFLGAGLTYRW